MWGKLANIFRFGFSTSKRREAKASPLFYPLLRSTLPNESCLIWDPIKKQYYVGLDNKLVLCGPKSQDVKTFTTGPHDRDHYFEVQYMAPVFDQMFMVGQNYTFSPADLDLAIRICHNTSNLCYLPEGFHTEKTRFFSKHANGEMSDGLRAYLNAQQVLYKKTIEDLRATTSDPRWLQIFDLIMATDFYKRDWNKVENGKKWDGVPVDKIIADAKVLTDIVKSHPGK